MQDQGDYDSGDGGCVHTQDPQGVRVTSDRALSHLEELGAELLPVTSQDIEKEEGQKSDFSDQPPKQTNNTKASI